MEVEQRLLAVEREVHPVEVVSEPQEVVAPVSLAPGVRREAKDGHQNREMA